MYFYYEGTMQDRAMALMGKKLTAAQALEGTFSSEGLVALAGEDANIEIALARSLVKRLEREHLEHEHLEHELQALARWQPRLKRAFNTVQKCQRKVADLERQLARLEE